MGLDIVELVMTIEEEFGIDIPDAECENIATIEQMVDAVYKRVQTKPNKKCLSQVVFYRLRRALEDFGNDKQHITPNTKMSELLSETNLKNDWMLLKTEIELNIPDLVDLGYNKTLNKEVRFFGLKVFDRTEPVAENTLRKFTDWVVSMNFEQLITLEQISSRYEIERIICGITEDKSGVPISEIELHHSFTNDLGMD